MALQPTRAAEAIFSRKYGPKIYGTIGSLAKDQFSTTELTKLAGVPQSEVSKELKVLVTLDLIISHGRNSYERIPNDFWRLMADLIEAWRL